MATQKQLREERALEKTVSQAESIAGAFKTQDRAEVGHEIHTENQEFHNVSALFGACRFCGQAQNVSDCMNEDEANEYAMRHCNCGEAKEYQDKLEIARRRKETLARVAEELDGLFGTGAADCGEVCPEVVDLLKQLSTLTYDKKIVSQTLKLTYTIQAKISRNAKGNISIERKDATAQKIEV